MSVWKLLAALTCGISLVSLLQRILKVGLIPIFGEFIGFYQEISLFIFGFLPSIFDINIHQGLADFWAFSLLATYIWARELVIFMLKAENINTGDLPFMGLGFLFLVFTGFGILTFLIAILWPLPKWLADKKYEEIAFLFEHSVVRTVRLSILIVVLFFACNAYAPSF